MNIQTDGTITTEVAVKKASQILIDHFMLLTGEKQPEIIESEIPESSEEGSGEEKESDLIALMYVWVNGTKLWCKHYQNGRPHRIFANGEKLWFKQNMVRSRMEAL